MINSSLGLRLSRHSASGTGIQHPGIQHPGIPFNNFARRLGVSDETTHLCKGSYNPEDAPNSGKLLIIFQAKFYKINSRVGAGVRLEKQSFGPPLWAPLLDPLENSFIREMYNV